MKQEDIDLSLAASGDLFGNALTMCEVAEVVDRFLSRLIDRGSWWERQVLRTVRGFVTSWRQQNGCS